jgi:molybdopterin synthase subunit MoaE/molybdopterin guanine dinucleotide biosynthesis accessory protein MobB
MRPLAVVGPPDADTAGLADRLATRLGERGRVGRVTRATAESTPDTGASAERWPDAGRATNDSPAGDRAYRIAEEGWTATGESLSLSDALGRLAVSCDYALVEGWSDPRLPTLALGGDTEDDEDSLLRAETADDVDPETVAETLDEVEPYETLGSLVARVKESPHSERAGAIATFTGRVRERDSPDDDPTEYLEFESYESVANERMATLREELEAREGVYEVVLHHRTGVVEAERDIVFVVVLAGHRPEAFRTVEDGIDRLKQEVPLFKKEVTVEGEFWAHEH